MCSERKKKCSVGNTLVEKKGKDQHELKLA